MLSFVLLGHAAARGRWTVFADDDFVLATSIPLALTSGSVAMSRWRGRGFVQEKSLADGGGHDVKGVSNIVFLLGDDVEVHPLPLLPLCLVEDPKSLEWPVAALGVASSLKASS
jgi:hypothetical protein